MHSFEVHSNESVCRKSGRLGLEQVQRHINKYRIHTTNSDLLTDNSYVEVQGNGKDYTTVI